MSKPHLRRSLLALALVCAGCGVDWFDGSPEDEVGAPVEAVAEPTGQSVPDGPEAGPEAADDATAGQAQTGQATPGPAVPAQPADSGATPDSAAQAQPVVDARIEQLLTEQQSLNRRMDSLLAVVSTQARPDSGQGVASGGDVISGARDQVRSFGVGVFWSVLVIIVFNFLVRGTVWVLDRLSEQSVKRRLFYKRLVPIVRIVLWIFAAYLIVSVIFRVDAQGIFAAAAAIGVAIGFAAQDLLKNLFGGLILVFDQPFQVGDKISVGGTYGEVVSIGLRSTRIVTPDDNLVSVPNAQVVDQQVANANAGELNCQVVTDLYLPGFVDEARAKKIAFEAAASSKYVFLNKPIVVLVADQFKETFLTRVRVKAYVLDPRFEFLFQSDVTERARAGFRDAGLTGPQQVVHGIIDLGASAATKKPVSEPLRLGGHEEE